MSQEQINSTVAAVAHNGSLPIVPEREALVNGRVLVTRTSVAASPRINRMREDKPELALIAT